MLASFERPIPRRILGFTATVLVGLCGCDRQPFPHPPTGTAAPPPSSEAGYHPAPSVSSVDRTQVGRVDISGAAQPGSLIRLSTPGGRVLKTTAGADGRWRIDTPTPADLRLYGVSMVDRGRTVQSEGYLAVAPDLAAQIRAGAGAVAYEGSTASPRLLAIDFDGKGGCVVSGRVAPGRAVIIDIDGQRRGGVRAGDDGRFSLALDEPVIGGLRHAEVVDGARRAAVDADLTPAGPMPAIPIRAVRIAGGWRVDWMTPGGGVQSTLLFAPTPERPL